jgi:hypothetical protein
MVLFSADASPLLYQSAAYWRSERQPACRNLFPTLEAPPQAKKVVIDHSGLGRSTADRSGDDSPESGFIVVTATLRVDYYRDSHGHSHTCSHVRYLQWLTRPLNPTSLCCPASRTWRRSRGALGSCCRAYRPLTDERTPHGQ